MKNTPLTERHLALGAKMAEFAGYNMPISYTNINDEHMAVREAVGMFDVSHMGEFVIRGKEAMELIQSVTSNDASKLEIGDAQYSCLPNAEGGIVDDLLVYRLPEENCSDGERAYMLVVNASNIEKDWNWIKSHNTFDAKMIDISDESALLAVQGPKAVETLQKLTEVNLSEIKYYHFVKGTFAGVKNVIISATGYTGSGGFELYFNNGDVVEMWDKIMEAGKEFDIKPTGLGARDTLRLEMGFCLYGNDINDSTSPIEAGLGWITKTKIEADFTSKDIFTKQRAEGIERKLVAFTTNERRVPRHGYALVDAEGFEIGEVTSGTQSPCLDKPIGMGYVPKSMAKVGTKIYYQAGKKQLEAEIVKLPFYKG